MLQNLPFYSDTKLISDIHAQQILTLSRVKTLIFEFF